VRLLARAIVSLIFLLFVAFVLPFYSSTAAVVTGLVMCAAILVHWAWTERRYR